MHGTAARSWLPGLVVLAVLTAFACAPAAPAPTTAPAAAPASGAPAASAVNAWDQVVAAARREGTVVVKGPPGVDSRDGFTNGFRQQHPDIEVDYSGGRGAEMVPKVLAERQAGRYLSDLFIGGTTTLLADLVPAGAIESIHPYLGGPESQDLSKWLDGRLDFADDAAQYNLVFAALVKVPIAYNPRLVSASELTSYRSLLDPKWRGKVAMLDPRGAGTGLAMASFFYATPSLGKDYLEQLFSSGITFTKDERQLVDWVGRGQYPIALAASENFAVELIRRGVQIELLEADALREGSYLTAAFGSVGVLERPPHPNAARVYLNWLLSREGQTDFSTTTGYPSRRLDVSTDTLFAPSVPKPGVRYQENYKEPFIKIKDEVETFLRGTIRE